jgi:hypothetical protein
MAELRREALCCVGKTRGPTGRRLRGDRFYFTLGDRKSDLWMTEIAGSR